MTVCEGCLLEFPLLDPIHSEDGKIQCSKCKMRNRAGILQPDLIALHNRPQCQGCGLVSERLHYAICNGCVLYYQRAESIPRTLLMDPGIANLLSTGGLSNETGGRTQNAALDLLEDAYHHKEQASDARLGKPKSTAPGINKFKNLKKGMDVVGERKAKKEEFDAAKKNHILLSGALFLTSRAAGDKMVQVPLCKGYKLLHPFTSIQTAFNGILESLRVEFIRVKPHITTPLTWNIVSPYAQLDETANGYASLQGIDFGRPLSALLEAFQNNKWGKPSKLADRQIAVRFVVLTEDLDLDDEDDDYLLSKKASGVRASSKRKRQNTILQSSKSAGFLASRSLGKSSARSVTAPGSSAVKNKARPPVPLWPSQKPAPSRPATNDPSQALSNIDALKKDPINLDTDSDSELSPDLSPEKSIGLTAKDILASARLRTYEAEQQIQQNKPGSTIVRRSAFQPPSRRNENWTRHPKTLQEYSFYKITCEYAEDGTVAFNTSDTEEVIKIPGVQEWEPEDAVGFLGKGASKRGIYARYHDSEYAITQPMDQHMSQSEVEDILKKEMELLCQCHGFKQVFDQHATGNSCNVVAFKFNFEGSFIGKLKPSLTSQSRPLPSSYFLATPLLPCGVFNKKIEKFTGNDEVGKATTSLHHAVHAFAHFSYLYSQGWLVFCDLQGMQDKGGVMCLIDPQVHTQAVHREERHAYWDGGPRMVNKFLVDHDEGCSDNPYCKRLKLCGANPQTFEIRVPLPQQSPRRPEKKAKKNDLDFIINGP